MTLFTLLLGMPLSDMLSRHSMQLYSADMFSRTYAMLRRQLLSISDWSFSYSDLSQCIIEVCTFTYM